MYLTLNICYCFPELWDAKSGQGKKTHDYRNTYLYQNALQTCTELGCASDVASLPHRQFFGMMDDTYSAASHSTARTHNCWPGTVPWEAFLSARNRAPDPFILAPASLNCAVVVLRQAGLPTELVDKVMEHFGRASTIRAEDPLNPLLHSANSNQLRRYLTYCWQLIIRCSTMAEALKMHLDWQSIVTIHLSRLISGAKLRHELLEDDFGGDSIDRFSFE